MPPNLNRILALGACIICVLAAFGVAVSGVALFPLGVAVLAASFVV